MLQALKKAATMREVANKGSEARDHLANERTFLAWARTALGLFVLGIGSERVEEFRGLMELRLASTPAQNQQAAAVPTEERSLMGRTTGPALMISATLVLAQGTFQYYRNMLALQRGVFHPNRLGVALVTTCGAGISVLLLREHAQRLWRSARSQVTELTTSQRAA